MTGWQTDRDGESSLRPNRPGSLFSCRSHDEATARLRYLVEYHRRLGLLAGERGCGKTSLLDQFAENLRRGGIPVAQCGMLGLDPIGFVWNLATALGLNPGSAAPLHQLWRTIDDRIAENRIQRLSTVFLLDDAHRASADVLASIERLVYSDRAAEARLTVVLAIDGDQIGRLGAPLLDLAELRIDLARWDESETCEFLRSPNQPAAVDAPEFGIDAITRLYELTEGVPRRVDQLAQLARAAGAGQAIDRINAAIVEAAYEELAVTPATT